MNLSDDKSLVLACRAGDAAAWEALVNRYRKLIYSIPRRAGLSEHLAAEVFQQVFTVLFEKIDTIEQPERVQAWMVTMAKRESWRLVRLERMSESLTSTEEDKSDPLQNIPDTHPLADESIQKLQEQALVWQAFQKLDDRCNMLLSMLFYQSEPPPYAEIAAQLGISEGSIGPTRARCLQKLQKLLENSGY